jgi:excinuclease ABC subunit C
MRIEAFDVSNLSGTNIVGAMVVFLGGAPLKKDYRKFKIKSVTSKPNDVAGIYEMIKRRFSGTLCRSLSLPDLLLLDGGLPQLHAAERAVAEIGVRSLPMLALAKKEEAIYLPGRKSALKLNKHSPALCLLQRIRDEVHRFAISYHRLKRAKQFFSPEPL